MTTCSEALDMILQTVPDLPMVLAPLPKALERALAKDLYAQEAVPPFANVSMDGYAIRHEDLREGARIRVEGEVAAGSTPLCRLPIGAAMQVMTGAPLPDGADTVVPQEYTQKVRDWIELIRPIEKGAFIRWIGEDIAAGALAMQAGTRLKPAALGVLASLGFTEVPVRTRPRIAVISTGDELVDASAHPGPGQIRDSNTPGLCAQVEAAGGIPVPISRIPDRLEAVQAALEQARADCDGILTMGGVSVGNYDFVKPALESLGARPVFWRVAQRPGGPFGFWTWAGKPVFGLPGNPVSAMVMMERYVRPALRKMQGFRHCLRPERQVVLDERWSKAEPDGKAHLLRVVVREEADGLHARLTGSQSSGVLTSMLCANGLALVDGETLLLEPGAKVRVYMTDWPEDH